MGDDIRSEGVDPSEWEVGGTDSIDGVETMAMPQRDDTIEALKRRGG